MKEKRAFPTKKSKPISQRDLLDSEIQNLKSQYDELSSKDVASIKRFSEFPLSKKTLKGLNDAKFMEPTEIQRLSIGPALQGRDVLGAAITGSGKTLAFLIPVLEHLYMAKWSRTDGVAAIIISPTRELAYQIFETLKKVGKHHDFSAGLIIGGKNLKFERSRMDQCNILICTPGRLLQHMDENPLFNASTMEVLVLDEADRCLDMGFEQTLNAIIENFPPDRQTLLFSATQTSSVKDLARLNLKNPVYVGQPQAKQEGQSVVPKVVPDLLQQNYVVVALEDKITMLWSFIKNHLKQKIIVFLSSCKQVKYIFEIFCKLRPGTSLLALYGTLHQDRRIAIYNDFVKKSNVVLFATDIASRGLDFPSVNWVVQLDCPEDVTQYIHRAGRSARNKTRGESLLVLLPSEEEGMIEELGKKSISVRKILIDPKKLFSPRAKIEAYLAQNPELKASAQRAFVAYIKSVFLMKNKKVFNVMSLDFDAYAKSLGLVVTPRVRFLDRYLKKQSKTNKGGTQSDSDTDDEEKSTNVSKPSNDILFKAPESDSDSDDDDFIKIKRANHDIKGDNQHPVNGNDDDEEDLPPPVLRKKDKLITKAALAKKALKKNLKVNEKVKFDEEGHEIVDPRKQLQSELAKEYESKLGEMGGIDIEMAKQLLQEEDKFDKQRFRSLVKQKHKKLKEKLKKKDEEQQGSETDEDEGVDYDDGGDESDNSVDLSWLPDPSKVYKNKDDDESDVHDESPTEQTNVSRKHRHNSDPSEDAEESDEDFAEPVKKKSNVTSKLTLDDAEIIAAQLLANS
ncbi:probable ATP-dependent RNA helicase DDX10 [Musca vetustissima]|uniref:probable ATP-dependent RNA helicase DDX10 n=1 Tax=Musca vetustissima TaxID=27455 RepID=UPI002AB7176A|nr:probable ATP-dependent RNA helicase DDX10 [Musca vetustissima]